MLNSAKKLNKYKLNSSDGEIGKVKDFYFDDQHWMIRYLIADTGGWLSSRKVLLSPHSIMSVDKVQELINIELSMSQIENSPPLESDKPVSRQYQERLFNHFNYPIYWQGFQTIGMGLQAGTTIPATPHLEHLNDPVENEAKASEDWDPNLRSIDQVLGYHIQSTDDEIGHIEDFIIDDESWTIRYLVIDTKNWLPGKKVLVSPEWIKNIHWDESIVYIDLSSEAIQQSEEYREVEVLDRDYEIRLYEHYNRKRYWPDLSKDK